MDKKEIIAELKKLVLAHFNFKGFLADVFEKILDKLLDKIVEDSSNPYDNMAKAALLPLLKNAAIEELAKLIHKLLGDKDVKAAE